MTGRTPARDWVTWIGLGLVGLTAATWSFTALSDLARLVGVTAVIDLAGVRLHVAWGLPITVDVLAVVATRVWLRGVAPAEAVTYARRAAWGAILATILGNAYHGWLTGQGRVDAIVVSAAPAVVIGVIVHLAVLAGRPHPVAENRPVSADAAGDADPDGAPPTGLALVADAAEEEWDAKRVRLLAAGAGRPTLARELGITDHAAKKLIEDRASDRQPQKVPAP